MEELRQRTLQGCVLCLTGVVPAGMDFFAHPFTRWCSLMGALASPQLSTRTTHVVAARPHTQKWHEAVEMQRQGAPLHIVHPGWVFRAIATWRRPDERRFPAAGPPRDFLD